MERILVTGASGFIGTRVVHCLAQDKTLSVNGTFLTNEIVKVEGVNYYRLDVADKVAVSTVIRRVSPHTVIHIAGTKDIVFCENNPQDARRVHVEGTSNVVDACGELGSRIVYVSSDCVFDGAKELYSEDDVTVPFNTYGQMKLQGERIISNAGLSFAIVRSSILFGHHFPLQASNTVSDTIDRLIKQQRIEMPTNLYNTPIYVGEGAIAICAVASSSLEGVYHLAGRDRVSRYQLALTAARIFNLDERLIIPRESALGLRPTSSCLNSSKLEYSLGTTFSGILEGLKKMKSEDKLWPGISVLEEFDKCDPRTNREL